MTKKIKTFKASAIIDFIFCFLYFLLTAWFFALSNKFYLLFVLFACICLYNGLYVSTRKEKLADADFKKETKKGFVISTVLSLISLPSFILNIVARSMQEDICEPLPEKKFEKEHKSHPKVKYVTLILGVLMTFLFSFTANLVETTGYSVKVSDFTLTKEMTEKYNNTPLNGKTAIITNNCLSYGVTQYVPSTASESNPAPTVFVMPGFTRTKATMSQYCIELSRRGAVVFCIDPGSQGSTTYAGFEQDENGEIAQISATIDANGLNYLVQYVYNNTEDYPYVDRDKFGAVGHSAGGGNVAQTAQYFAGKSYKQSIIKSLYISGYIKTSAANRFKSLYCNSAMSYAYYDEGAFRYQDDNTAFEIIALRFINEIQGSNLGYDSCVIDYEYGDMDEGTYRVVHREKINHCFEMYDKESITNTISFFRESLWMDTDIKDTNQVWIYKESSNGLALVGGFMAFVSLSIILWSLPIFRKKKKMTEQQLLTDGLTVETKPIKKKSLSSKVVFWTTLIVTAIIACLDYIPLARWTMDLFPEAASNTYTYYFPARMMNAVMLWAVVNGTIGLVLFFLIAIIELIHEKAKSVREHRKPEYDFSKFRPLKINFADFIKTLIYACIGFAFFYGLVEACYRLFHADFRFMLISASPLQPRFIVTWAMYLPLFLIFYLSNSIRVNCSIGQKGFKEWQVMLLGGIANSIGLVFIIIINYVAFFKTGTVYYGYWGNPEQEVWLYINMVFPLIPMMFLLPILNRLFYKKSGNVYFGALINCMIFIMMSLSASVSYIPM